MKLLHLSDLHIGKKVHGYSMLEEQKHILDQILRVCESEKPDVVLLAGDIYDKPVPGEEAIFTMDRFLTSLNQQQRTVFLISGNHDSGERLQFGREIMEQRGIHIVGTFQGKLEKVVLTDQWGMINFYMLPFVKLSTMRKYYKEESCENAIRHLIQDTAIDPCERNILISHQFIINGSWMPERCESEIAPIGGLDSIDCSTFKPFDYVALGHLHRAQKVGRESIRYAGSPLKYSFSEATHKKSVVVVEINEKNKLKWHTIPLKPIHEMREIKGKLSDLIHPDHYQREDRYDYIRAILTDEEELYHPLDTLRNIYPNILRLDFENLKMRQERDMEEEIEKKTELELFEQFFQKQNQMEMTEEQRNYVKNYLTSSSKSPASIS